MSDAFLFWLMKPIADASVVLLLVIGAVLLAVLWNLPQAIRQQRCKHLRYTETSACEAICRDCGKNLGFIGAIRARDAEGMQKRLRK